MMFQVATAAVSLLDTGEEGLYVRFNVRDHSVDHEAPPEEEGDGIVLLLDMNGISERSCMVGENGDQGCAEDAEWFPKADGSGYNIVFHISLSEEERLSLDSGTASATLVAAVSYRHF